MTQYTIQFDYSGSRFNVPVTRQQLDDDASEKNDFWGEFDHEGHTFQVQIYQKVRKIAVFNRDGADPVGYAQYLLIRIP